MVRTPFLPAAFTTRVPSGSSEFVTSLVWKATSSVFVSSFVVTTGATNFLVPTSTISSTAGVVIVLDFSTRPVSTPSV